MVHCMEYSVCYFGQHWEAHTFWGAFDHTHNVIFEFLIRIRTASLEGFPLRLRIISPLKFGSVKYTLGSFWFLVLVFSWRKMERWSRSQAVFDRPSRRERVLVAQFLTSWSSPSSLSWMLVLELGLWLYIFLLDVVCWWIWMGLEGHEGLDQVDCFPFLSREKVERYLVLSWSGLFGFICIYLVVRHGWSSSLSRGGLIRPNCLAAWSFSLRRRLDPAGESRYE